MNRTDGEIKFDADAIETFRDVGRLININYYSLFSFAIGSLKLCPTYYRHL